MSKILNKEVSFSLAKLLKEKNWNKQCIDFYFEDNTFSANYYFDDLESSELINDWNDNFLTKKDGSRCFGCDKSKGYFETFSAPTIAEVIDWIYEKHNIWISIASLSDCYIVKIYKKNNNIFCSIPPSINIFELYEKAIEHTLKELIK